IAEVVSPRGVTYSVTCHQWLRKGESSMRTLPQSASTGAAYQVSPSTHHMAGMAIVPLLFFRPSVVSCPCCSPSVSLCYPLVFLRDRSTHHSITVRGPERYCSIKLHETLALSF